MLQVYIHADVDRLSILQDLQKDIIKSVSNM